MLEPHHWPGRARRRGLGPAGVPGGNPNDLKVIPAGAGGTAGQGLVGIIHRVGLVAVQGALCLGAARLACTVATTPLQQQLLRSGAWSTTMVLMLEESSVGHGKVPCSSAAGMALQAVRVPQC